MKRALLLTIVIAQLTLLIISVALAYSPEIDNALIYLNNRQSSDGSWGGNESLTDPYFTSTAVAETPTRPAWRKNSRRLIIDFLFSAIATLSFLL